MFIHRNSLNNYLSICTRYFSSVHQWKIPILWNVGKEMYFLNFNWNSVKIQKKKKISSQHLLLRLKNYIYKSVFEFFLAHCGGHTAARHRFQTKRDHALSLDSDFFQPFPPFCLLLSPIFSLSPSPPPPKEMNFNRLTSYRKSENWFGTFRRSIYLFFDMYNFIVSFLLCDLDFWNFYK